MNSIDDLLSFGEVKSNIRTGKVSSLINNNNNNNINVSKHNNNNNLNISSLDSIHSLDSNSINSVDSIDYHTYIREKVKEQVDDCLWLNDLKQMYIDLKERIANTDKTTLIEKCLICTLPIGTCKHSSNWYEDQSRYQFSKSELDHLVPESQLESRLESRLVDREIAAALGVLGPDPGITSSHPGAPDDVELSSARWTRTTPRASDALGQSRASLSAPCERGWHSCTLMNNNNNNPLLVVFGGYRYNKRATPKAFGISSNEANENLQNIGQYLNDIHVYDVNNNSWHKPITIIVDKLDSTIPMEEIKINPLTGDVIDSTLSGEKESRGPPGRYGHIAAAIDENRLLIFGGRGSNGRFLNDTWIYNIQHASWFHVKPINSINNSYGNSIPSPRVFSAAVSIKSEILTDNIDLSATRMFRDSYLDYSNSNRFNNNNNNTNNNVTLSKAIHIELPSSISSVYIFGGTNGTENLCDLWIFKGNLKDMGWEQIISVGNPPSSRYGHRMVYNYKSGNIMILGGCAIGPYSEIISGSNDHNLITQQNKQLFDISTNLQESYRSESIIAKHGGEALLSNLKKDISDDVIDLVRISTSTSTSNIGENSIKELTTQAAHIAATIQSQEYESRKLELQLSNSFYLAKADKIFRQQFRAKHPDKYLDIYFLDVHHLTWKPQIFPPISGNKPTSRIHFGAMILGDFCFIVGGATATALTNVTADNNNIDSSYTYNSDNNKNFIKIYALNLKTMVWTNPIPIENVESLAIPLQIAETDIIRAKHRVEAEKDRAKSLKAIRGMTVELAEAEAILKVCEWRKNMLIKEQNELIPSPDNCFGVTFERIGQRGFLLGGWDNTEAINTTKYLLMLDLEVEHERRRRLNDEFHAKLERDRLLDEKKSFLEKLQSSYELRAMLAMEKINERRENRLMYIEDICSSLPPLTKPMKPICRARNQHTIWVQWEDAIVDSFGYQRLCTDDRILIYSYKKPKNIKEPKAVIIEEQFIESDDDNSTLDDQSLTSIKSLGDSILTTELFLESLCFDNPKTILDKFSSFHIYRYSGDILKSHHNGLFDIAFDDGGYEYNVPRRRIRLDNVYGENTLPNDAANIAHRRLRTKLLKKYKRRRAYEKRVRKGTLIKKQFGSNSILQIGYIPPEEKLNNENLNIIGNNNTRLNSPNNLKINTNIEISGIAINNGHESISESDDSDDSDFSNYINYDDTNSINTTYEISSIKTTSTTTTNTTTINEKLKKKKKSKLKWPQEDIRPHYQLYRYLPYDKDNFIPTVIPDPSTGWNLVYHGSDTSYACTNLIPDSIIAEENNLCIPVAFILQTCGTEYPLQEHSLCSDPLIIWTKIPKINQELDNDLDDISINSSLDVTNTTNNNNIDKKTISNNSNNSNNNTSINNSISTTESPLKRNNIITTKINGYGKIDIEKKHNYYISTGVSNQYI